ncbi:MAG: OB-fold domain-containing protein [Burkholderiales bacterium]|jgi:hypothetical protein|nr:OB-fold domain-containing protein [Burkholderiales bacterium]MBP7520064.1 OB-fold domain-containing protein [Leptothrix sp. (in: b-proteobacteria)]
MSEAQPQAFYQAELDAGRWRIQRCGGCGRHVFFPRVGCPHCGDAALDWVAPSGLGTVYAVTTLRRKPAEGGDLNVSLVDLDEGVRMMSRIANQAPAAVRIGQRVQARVETKDSQGLVVFDVIDARPTEGPA